MKRILATVAIAMAALAFGSFRRAGHTAGTNIVLPNSRLLGCRSSACSQLWQGTPSGKNAIFPRQVIVDVFGDESCPRGIVALYDKSVSMENLEASIDELYGRWGHTDNETLPVKLWRVEPQQFAIQLAVAKGEKDVITRDQALAEAFGRSMGYGDRSNVGEAGMKQIIYLTFAGTKCGSQ